MGDKHEQVLGVPSMMNIGALGHLTEVGLIEMAAQQGDARRPVAINATRHRAASAEGLWAPTGL
jgi:hypothetical protein